MLTCRPTAKLSVVSVCAVTPHFETSAFAVLRFRTRLIDPHPVRRPLCHSRRRRLLVPVDHEVTDRRFAVCSVNSNSETIHRAPPVPRQSSLSFNTHSSRHPRSLVPTASVESLRQSAQADIAPVAAIDKMDFIDANLGELSRFHEAFGFYVHGVPIDAAVLPIGWNGQSKSATTTRGTIQGGALRRMTSPSVN